MTTNVGRVQASIVPDVSGFAAQADAALTPEMSNLGRKLGETLSRAMTRAIDFSGINTGLHRALRLAETQAAGSGREVGRGFARALRTELTAELQNMPEVNVKVSLDRTSLAEFRAQIANLTRPVHLPVLIGLDTAAVAAYRAHLAFLTQPQTQTITINHTGGSPGGLPNASGNNNGGGADSSAFKPGLKSLAVGAGLLLSPSIGALVPMMAGAALGAGTMAVAFKGVGDALKAAGGDQKAYNAALKKLSPEQRGFTKALVSLKKEFAPIGREVQKAMLPAFTKTVKAAGPIVKILGKGMTSLGTGFADAAAGAERLFKSSGFQKELKTNLDLGQLFVRDMTGGLGSLLRSLLTFGAKSGPTLKSFSTGLSGLLGKGGGGLAGMFKGLEVGIGGSAKFLDGLFSLINRVLPAIGRFSGEVSRSLGPLLGEMLTSSGVQAEAALDGLGQVVKALTPVFKDLGFGIKAVRDLLGIFAPTMKDVGSAILGSFLPSFSRIDEARGPLQRLSDAINTNKGTIQEVARIMGNAFIDIASTAIEYLPKVIGIWALVTGSMVTGAGAVLHALAETFGFIPGIGDKLKAADRDFGNFKDSYLSGLATAQRKSEDFANNALPKLGKGRLKLNIDNWTSQIATAKAKLKTVPPEGRSKLKADIADLQAKVASAKRQLDNFNGKSATAYINVQTRYTNPTPGPYAGKYVFGRANGGLIKGYASGGQVAPTGGPVFGPGTGTSDSIPTWLSNGEYVIRAKSVAKYGLAFMDTLNKGTLGMGRMASGGLAGSEVASGLVSGMKGGTSKVHSAARTMAAAVEAGVRTELQIASPSKKMQQLAKEIGAGLIKGLTGSRDQIKSASASLAKSIWDTFSGSTDNRLVGMFNQQTKKLLDLAAKRDKVAASLAAGQQMAKDQKASGLSFASMTSLPNGGNTFDAGGILSGLKVRLGQLKAFSGNIAKLAKMGLSKDLIGQLIAAGPEGGAAYAAALVKATPGQLKALNSTQSQIAKASSSYGNSAADIMYDAGSQAGKGFLTGLTAQKKSIEDAMSSLAKAIQKAIKKALKIKSPSRVMAEIGQHVGQGLVMGMDATHEAVGQSARRMGSMATQVDAGISNYRPSPERSSDIHFHTNSVTDKPTRETVMYALRDYSALNPLVA
ncbi:hypothetical protein [Streptomyces sp. NPDC005077]|uniref:hypothetical protein n=1 Tax=Streptomyces sp. NPDC005077 TaxID=3154292 RepID=UPI0033A16498